MRKWLGVGLVCFGLAASASFGEPATLLGVMQAELARCQRELQAKSPPGPYFIGYAVTETESLNVVGMSGALVVDSQDRDRALDVDVRSGSYALDNTHGAGGGTLRSGEDFPLDDEHDALLGVFFRPTEEAWRAASTQLENIKTNQAVTIQQADAPADFSQEPPQQYNGALLHLSVPRADWEQAIRRASKRLAAAPDVQMGVVSLTAEVHNHYYATTEGTSEMYGDVRCHVDVAALAQADDGLQISRIVSVEARDPARLPQGQALDTLIDNVVTDLHALRQAPVMEPFVGPAILSGHAAAVFFHEIFGHRIEGHRQKGDASGQTFTHDVDKPVLPPFISVVDDPTTLTWQGTDLVGAYPYDDEGVKAQPVVVVDKGVFKSFLMSRSPVTGFAHSNGHGRRAPGFRPVGRQGNLLVTASNGLSDAELRRRLITLCQQQGKPYGIFIDDVNGGFTMTGRALPQAFEVRPAMVYRVYVDGRPDELVRGVALIGTPLTAFSKIVACGDRADVFNGICGAESGPVPVSAVAPPLLIEQIELQKEPTSDQRLPILPPPQEGTP